MKIKKERHSDVMNPKSFLFNFWGHLNSRHTLLFFSLAFLPPFVFLSSFPRHRMPSDDFSQKSHFSHISIVQNLHISNIFYIFALDFKSVLFSRLEQPLVTVHSNVLQPSASPRNRLNPATTSPHNYLDLQSRFYKG